MTIGPTALPLSSSRSPDGNYPCSLIWSDSADCCRPIHITTKVTTTCLSPRSHQTTVEKEALDEELMRHTRHQSAAGVTQDGKD